MLNKEVMSKLLLSILLLLATSAYCVAQNLVPNPSFEDKQNCPGSFGQIACPLTTPPFPTTVTDWISAVPNSPDYYNACSGSIYASIPVNYHGNHPARTGSAYVGIVGFSGHPSNGPSGCYFEYVECKLTQPLQAGSTYIVSCYVQLASRKDTPAAVNLVAMKQLGAFLSNIRVDNYSTPINYTPTHLTQTNGAFMSSETNWQYISGEYTATGGEEWLTLGWFNYNNQNPAFQNVYPTTTLPNTPNISYYLIDDVSVIKKPSCDTVYNYTDTVLCNSNSLPITLNSTYTDASTQYSWSNGGNSISTNASIVGKYWCIATNGCNLTVDTFNIYLNDDKHYGSTDTLICSPDSITLSTRDNALSYLWSTGDTTHTISPTKYGSYWCTTQVGCSQYIDTIILKPLSLITNIDLGKDVDICDEQSITLGKLYPGDNNYSWNNGEGSCCILAQKQGLYILTVSDQCVTLTDSIRVDKHGCQDCFFVPSAFTPNGDGLNDILRPIPQCDIEHYIFRIYNRWGEMVYQTRTLNIGWNGQYKGQPADIGTYYYYIEYNTKQDETKRLHKGDITIIK